MKSIQTATIKQTTLAARQKRYTWKTFHGNKACESVRRIREIGERMRLAFLFLQPEIYYQVQYEELKLKGKFKDDWGIDYTAWSPSKGESVAVEWLNDIKSSLSHKVMSRKMK